MVLAVKPRRFFLELAKYDYKEEELNYTEEDRKEINSVVLPAPVDVLANEAKLIDVKDAKFNQGYNRVLQGVITDRETKSSAKSSYGIIELRDFVEVTKRIKIKFFDNHLNALFYAKSTEVFVFCFHIDENEKWGLQAIGRDIIPIHETPTTISKLTSDTNDEPHDKINEYTVWDDDISETGVESTFIDDWYSDTPVNKKTETATKKANSSKPKKQTFFDMEDWL
jgi:hypothetical protein